MQLRKALRKGLSSNTGYWPGGVSGISDDSSFDERVGHLSHLNNLCIVIIHATVVERGITGVYLGQTGLFCITAYHIHISRERGNSE